MTDERAGGGGSPPARFLSPRSPVAPHLHRLRFRNASSPAASRQLMTLALVTHARRATFNPQAIPSSPSVLWASVSIDNITPALMAARALVSFRSRRGYPALISR